jgi:hypothetical protein
MMKIVSEILSAKLICAGAMAPLKRASGEWFPLQQMCPELGVSGVAGSDSWQPGLSGVFICTVANAGGPISQATWNKSVAIAANAATLIDH